MINKKEFAEFCFSLNEEQRKLFLEILDCDINELLKDEEAQNDIFGVRLFLKQLTFKDIEWKPTKDVYEQCQNFCKRNEIIPTNKIHFSKAVKEYFPVDIINTKINGVKYRVFVLKDGVGA